MALEQRVFAQLSGDLYWGVFDGQLTVYPTNVTDTGMIFRDASMPPTDTTVPADPAAADRSAIIAAGVLSRITDHNSYGGQDVFANVGIVETVGTPLPSDASVDFGAADPLLTDAEKAAIEDAIAPKHVVWLPADNDVLRAALESGQVDAYVMIAAPTIDGDSATIITNMICGGLCGTGSAFVLARQSDGTWTVTGETGVTWIS